jgi:hypothetical protein
MVTPEGDFFVFNCGDSCTSFYATSSRYHRALKFSIGKKEGSDMGENNTLGQIRRLGYGRKQHFGANKKARIWAKTTLWGKKEGSDMRLWYCWTTTFCASSVPPS